MCDASSLVLVGVSPQMCLREPVCVWSEAVWVGSTHHQHSSVTECLGFQVEGPGEASARGRAPADFPCCGMNQFTTPFPVKCEDFHDAPSSVLPPLAGQSGHAHREPASPVCLAGDPARSHSPPPGCAPAEERLWAAQAQLTASGDI